MSDYANPELLAETDWLAGQLDDPSVRIVDCDPVDAYARAHITGAVTLTTHFWLKEPERGTHVMNAEKFAATMSAAGIDENTTVVAYDARGGVHAARLWWALTFYGHTRVKVLNGGWKKWFHEQKSMSTQSSRSAA